ncbi:ABC transporter ATP-binding protein [Roseibium alexandrii]|uniref:ABC-type sugar transport system, ATPase component n=1 Tax=Roseibium alexandrii (strain DSM 17067 / NCIMB 14079 / DFL-11) TaxID=244592 RepID=A0A5E8H593_ROSAD|nr:ABC transporter ATP-binding protein [Roseibium alexandrii]EEE47158.1 ABC-type sugar transport system, ATPase component [Roseibium alexandrii DFL-11]
MAAISIKAIEKSFGETPVLEGINLDIAPGEFLTLVGPSGCGKSTLLRILAGLEAPGSGDVLIDGRKVNQVRPADRNLAMVFQSYALYPHLTVGQNMMTPLRLRDLSFAERLPFAGPLLAKSKYKALWAQVAETAKILQIDHLLDRKPGQLSGGQRQRAALGRAMVRKPAGFLMDEPLSNLDAALRIHMRSELAELHRSLATTFVYVTHDQAEALTMSDRMAVMMDGNILQLGTPDEIYNNPQDIRVAEFVGAPKINLLPGHLDSNGHARCGDVVLTRVAATSSDTITIGLRPEHLTLCNDTDPEALKGRVVHKENLGADIYLHISMKDGAHRLVIRAAPIDGVAVSIGQDVAFKRHHGAAMIFEAGGKRIGLDNNAGTAVAEVA